MRLNVLTELMKQSKVLVILVTIGGLLTCCVSEQSVQKENKASSQSIKVDGKIDDWEDVPSIFIQDKDQLWTDSLLKASNWTGKKDLSCSWKVAWHDQKLFFLFQVTDDVISDFNQEFTWMNDCIELHVDPENLEGGRIEGIDETDPLEERLGKKSYGYEMHFLPDQPPAVYVDDTKNVFYTDSIQNKDFEDTWDGEAITQYMEDGYVMEIGFLLPTTRLESGKVIGLDVVLCDDDGDSRETLMIWSGFQGPFWIIMDHFNKIVLE